MREGKPIAQDKKEAEVPSDTLPQLLALMGEWYNEAIENRRSLGIDAEVLAGINADRMIASPSEEQMFAALGVTKETYDPVTHTRCTAARSLMMDVVGGTISSPWGLTSSPYPSVPEDVEAGIVAQLLGEYFKMLKMAKQPITQDGVAAFLAGRFDDINERKVAWANKRAPRMERLVSDVLVEGYFNDSIENIVGDMCVRGTGIIGWTDQLRNVINNRTGRWVRGIELRKIFRRVDMLDAYPMPGVTDFDGGGVFVRVRWPIDRFAAMAKRPGPGWIASSVQKVVDNFRDSDPQDTTDQGAQTEQETKRAEKVSSTGVVRHTVSGVEFWGNVPERVLVRGGGSKRINIMATFQGNTLIRFRRLREFEKPPYAKAHFYHTAASFFGVGIPRVLVSAQAALNVVSAMLKRNSQLASSASLVFNDFESLIGRERPGAASLDTWKIFPFMRSTSGAQLSKPVELLQLESRTNDLARAYELFQTMADEASGVLRYVYGQASGASGAGRTLGGLRMLRDSALRGITAALANLDRGIVKPVVQMVTEEMNLSPLVSDQIKCDCTVVSAGILGMVQRSVETQERMQTLIGFANSPVLTQVAGLKVIQGMARAVLSDQNIADLEKNMPSQETLEFRELMQMLTQTAQTQEQAAAGQDGSGEAGGVPPQPGDVGQMPSNGPASGSVAERRGAA